MYSDNDDSDWEVLYNWRIDKKSDHKNVIEYTYVFEFDWLFCFSLKLILIRYSIPYPDGVTFSWLFSSDNTEQGTNEVRIYEIRVTNTKRGGSDRCISCLTTNNQETE